MGHFRRILSVGRASGPYFNRFHANSRKMAPLFQEILGTCIVASGRAGDLVRNIMRGGELEIVEKTGANDLQTAADRIANDVIVGSLKRSFPGLAVIGEEGDAQPLDDTLYVKTSDKVDLTKPIPEKFTEAQIEDLTVWVDPLDATKEYTEGHLDHVTVLVGIALGDQSVAGVIHQPFYGYQNKTNFDGLGRTVFGVIGAGVGGPIHKTVLPEGLIATTSRSHSNSLVNKALEAINPSEVIRVGGSGYKVMLLIEGKAHAYVFPSPGCKKWDTCAPEAILHALGGKLTDIRGNRYRYNQGVGFPNEWGVLATATEELHDRVLSAIPDSVKCQVKDYYKKK